MLFLFVIIEHIVVLAKLVIQQTHRYLSHARYCSHADTDFSRQAQRERFDAILQKRRIAFQGVKASLNDALERSKPQRLDGGARKINYMINHTNY